MSMIDEIRAKRDQIKQLAGETERDAFGRIGRLEAGLAEAIDRFNAKTAELEAELAAIRALAEKAETEHERRQAEAQAAHDRREREANDALEATKAELQEILIIVADMAESVQKGVQAVKDYGASTADRQLPAVVSEAPAAIAPLYEARLSDEDIRRLAEAIRELQGDQVMRAVAAETTPGGMSFGDLSPITMNPRRVRAIAGWAISGDATALSLEGMVFRLREALDAMASDDMNGFEEAISQTYERREDFQAEIEKEIKRRMTVAEQQKILPAA